MKVAFISCSNESLGIEYLSAYLKQQGHKTRVFIDPQLFNDEHLDVPLAAKIFSYQKNLVKKVIDYNPDLIGFSVVSDFYHWACDLAREFKKHLNVPIIFGGIHASSVPEEVIKNKFVDMVCIGEGEEALAEVVNRLENRQNPVDVLNVWAKKDGNIIKNKLRPLINDLDHIPYPDKKIYYDTSFHFQIGYYTIASRGCLYTCTYCHHSFLRTIYPHSDYYRVRSVGNIIEELSINFDKKKHKVIRFSDDIFPFKEEWLKEFADKFKARINAPFICYIHPDTINPENIDLLKKSGCVEVQLGIQTLYEQTQKKILNRNISQKRWQEVFLLLYNANIKITAENILGIPNQEICEIEDLIRFYCYNKADRIQVFWLKFYPKTKIKEFINQIDKNTQVDNSNKEKTFTQGGDIFTKELAKLRIIFCLLHFLPPKVIEWLLANKRYQSCFLIPLWILNLISNFTSKVASDKITRKREWMKYLIFVQRRFIR
ncbi:MAG: radical SAM protein [Candidatus Omnitrophota bacterium]